MRGSRAWGRPLWPALVAAAALLLTAPQAFASRTPGARPGLLASPALEQIPTAAGDLVPAYAPRGFELQASTAPHLAAFALFPVLAPAPAAVEPEKLASGLASWELTANLKRIQVFVADAWQVREKLGPVDSPNLYQAFGLDPQNNADPLGLVNVVPAETPFPNDVFATVDWETGMPWLDYSGLLAANTARNTCAWAINMGWNALASVATVQQAGEEFLYEHTPLQPGDIEFLQAFSMSNPVTAPGAVPLLRARLSEAFTALRENKVVRLFTLALQDERGFAKVDLLVPGLKKEPITDPSRLLPGITAGEEGRLFQKAVHEALREPENTLKFTKRTRSGRLVNTEPDLFGLRTGVTEVKDVRELSFDKQLQAQFDVARQHNKTFNIVVSSKTETISVPLQQAIRARRGIIVEFDQATQSFKSITFDPNHPNRIRR